MLIFSKLHGIISFPYSFGLRDWWVGEEPCFFAIYTFSLTLEGWLAKHNQRTSRSVDFGMSFVFLCTVFYSSLTRQHTISSTPLSPTCNSLPPSLHHMHFPPSSPSSLPLPRTVPNFARHLFESDGSYGGEGRGRESREVGERKGKRRERRKGGEKKGGRERRKGKKRKGLKGKGIERKGRERGEGK